MADIAIRPETQDRYLDWDFMFERGVFRNKMQARRMWERGEFPKPVFLSRNRLAWRESEFRAWEASLTSPSKKSEAA